MEEPEFFFFLGEGRGEGVGKVATDDQFHLSTRTINKVLKASGVRGRKIANIGAMCIVAVLLDAGFLLRKPEFSQLLVDFGFVVDKVAQILFPSVTLTPTVSHILSFMCHRRNIIFTTETVVT